MVVLGVGAVAYKRGTPVALANWGGGGPHPKSIPAKIRQLIRYISNGEG